MVKKLKKIADKQAASPAAGLFDSAIAATVRDSAQQIWLAGLGAFSKAQAEGGKVFETLVKEGLSLHKRTQNAAGERLNEVTSKMTGMATDVTAKAGQHWGKLETIFEERVSKAMNKLGVPSAKDVSELIKRIDDLSAQVARLTKEGAPAAPRKTARAAASNGSAGTPAAAPRKRAPRKTAAKSAAAKSA